VSGPRRTVRVCREKRVFRRWMRHVGAAVHALPAIPSRFPYVSPVNPTICDAREVRSAAVERVSSPDDFLTWETAIKLARRRNPVRLFSNRSIDIREIILATTRLRHMFVRRANIRPVQRVDKYSTHSGAGIARWRVNDWRIKRRLTVAAIPRLPSQRFFVTKLKDI